MTVKHPLPLIGAGRPPERETPVYPYINVQFIPPGCLIQNMLGPGLSINTVIGPEAMDKLARDWLAHRQQQQQEEVRPPSVALLQHLAATRND